MTQTTSTFKRVSQDWNQYFFQQAPLDALAVYRIFFGVFVAIESICWLPYAEELFSMEGFHFRYLSFSARLTVFESQALCVLTAVFALCVAAGYYTKVNILFTWICFGLLHSVDSINEKAIESIILVVLVLLFFSRCDRLYSLDVLLGRKNEQKQGSVFVQRLLQWEFAQIYFFCGLTKMMVPDWPTGKVLLDSLMGRWGTFLGVWVSGLLPSWLIHLSGFGTILFELFIGFLLLTPWFRGWAVAASLCFHFAIQLLLNIGSLGVHFMIADLLLFFDPQTVSKALESLRKISSRRAPRRVVTNPEIFAS